ncbi:MAG TPA: undecaprenyl-diphosphate phosphatase [Methanomicrobiales archaeon]|nr:undecaprenyl-diphosphate phosphatase [Methanomicrobiales archaeon]
MDLFSILVLGLVQGITEWIPISSKTQDTLVYLSFLHGNLNLVVPILLYLHLGTVLSAALYFRGELRSIVGQLLRGPGEIRARFRGETGFLVTALLFTGLMGIPLLILEKESLGGLNASLLFIGMGAGLLITGVLLLLQKRSAIRQREQVTWKDGVLTGLLQGLSVLPGVSRAGTSTTGLIWRGFDGESSFHLSFLLGIPTVVLAELIFYINGSLLALPVADGILLTAVSFLVGYVTIDLILKIVRRVNLAYLALALGLFIIGAGVAGLG